MNGIWFPVRQAFELALGAPRANFNSHTARRHLTTLGFEVRGQIATRTDAPGAGSSLERGSAAEWFGEAEVQAVVVSFLSDTGWRIVSTADTATKERGVDVVAERVGQLIGIEVKGFHSRSYANPRRNRPARVRKRVIGSLRPCSPPCDYAGNNPAGAV